MSRAPAASLAGVLPFWRLLPLPSTWLSGGSGHASQSIACLLQKDGTLAVGLTIRPFDAYGANDDAQNLHAAIWQRMLASLPDGGFLQVIFRRGYGFDAAVDAFARAGANDSHPLLREGRARRAAALREQAAGAGTRITYWLGQRRLLKHLQQGGRGRKAIVEHTARSRSHCQEFLRSIAPALASLRQAGLAPTFLHAQEILSACQDAIYGVGAPSHRRWHGLWAPPEEPEEAAPVPTPLWGQTNLDVHLAEGALETHEQHLAWQQPWLPEPRLLQASSVCQLGDETQPKMLHDLLYEQAPETPFVLSVCHEKSDQVLQKEKLQQRRKWLFALIGNHFLNHEAEHAYRQTEQILATIGQQGAQLFRTSITCVTSAESPEALAHATRTAQAALQPAGVQLEVQHQQQMAAWRSALPGFGYSAPTGLALLDGNCAHLVPSWLPPRGDAECDIMLATRQQSPFGLSVRVGPRPDASAIVVGKTGSGKSFLFSMLAKYGCLDVGGHLVIADNKGPKNSSYKPLCELLGGTYVHLEAEQNASFNPFPPPEEVLVNGQVHPERVFVLEQILAMMAQGAVAEGNEDYLRSVVADVVRALYARPDVAERPLVLDDALAALDAYRGRNATLQQVAARVRERLEFWCEDPVRRRLFNTPGRMSLGSRFTVFDFFGMDRDPQLSAVLIAAFAGQIEGRMRALPPSVPKLFAFDEAWAMFDHSPRASELLNRLFRTARSYGAACYVLTQHHRDIEQSSAGRGILANLALIYLMRHQDGHEDVARMFGLSERQAQLFASLRMDPGAFSEFLLVDGNARTAHVLSYAPLAFDLWCDTSRAMDVAFRRRAQAESGLPLPELVDALASLAPRGAPEDRARQKRLIEQLAARGAANEDLEASA